MENKKKADGYRQLALFSDYQETFNTPAGKKVLMHLMKAHGLMDKSFVEDNQYATAFNEGGRNVVLNIMKKLRMDIKKVEQLLIEESKLEEGYDVNY